MDTKTSAMVVWSVGKTGSTTMYDVCRGSAKPGVVVHTHGDGRYGVQYNSIAPVLRQTHTGDISGFLWSFPASTELRIIGMVRNPVSRRVSQFFNSLCMNNICENLIMSRTGAPPETPLSRETCVHTISTARDEDIARIVCPIQKRVVWSIRRGKDMTLDEVVALFQTYFFNPVLVEYDKYFESMSRALGIELPSPSPTTFDMEYRGHWAGGSSLHLYVSRLEDLGSSRTVDKLSEMWDVSRDSLQKTHRRDKMDMHYPFDKGMIPKITSRISSDAVALAEKNSEFYRTWGYI